MTDDVKDNVIRLAFSNEHVARENMGNEWLTCQNCSNKAWTLRYSNLADYPELLCTCCGGGAGLVAFVELGDTDEDDD